MTSDEMQAAVERYVEATNLHDAQAVAALYLEDAVSRDMGRDMALMGRAAISESLVTYFAAFPDVVMGISRIGADAALGTAYLEWHATATHRGPYDGVAATGHHVEVDGCIVFTFAANGLITSDIGYWDVASLLRQLSLPPLQGAGPRGA